MKFARLKGVSVTKLPSHHITRLDHRIKQRGIIAKVDHKIGNLPNHPTVLTFEKRKDSDFLRVLTGKRGNVKKEKSSIRKFLESDHVG